MRNARISIILWLLFPLLAAAQLPPLTRSVLTTNIPAFGSAGQALFRIAIPPYLNWSNVVASGGLSITESNNIINLASNYTWAVSNYAWTASSGLTNDLNTVSNSVLNTSSNYIFAVSNLVVSSTNGHFILNSNGFGTNTVFYGNIGMGTNAPKAALHIIGDGGITNLIQAGNTVYDQKFMVTTNGDVIVNLNTNLPTSSLLGTGFSVRGADDAQVRVGYSSYGAAGIGAFAGRHARGIASTPTAVQLGDTLFSGEGWGYGSTGYSVSPRVMFRGYAGGTWSDTDQPSYASVWTTPIGSVVPSEIIRVSTNGNTGFGTTVPLSKVHIQTPNNTGPALTIGTNSGATFSIMGVTNGPSPYLVQVGSPMVSANVGGTNAFLISTNGNAMFMANLGIQKVPISALDVSGSASVSSTLFAGTYAFVASSRWSSIADGIISFRNAVGTDFNGFIFGTNSASGTNSAALYMTNNGAANTPIPTIYVTAQNGVAPANFVVKGGITASNDSTINGVLTVKSNVVAQGGLISTNDFVYQRDQTGSALTIGTNAGAVFSIMGVTNGPSQYLVQVGSGMLAANSGGTNTFLIGTNGNSTISGSLTAGGNIGTLSGANINSGGYVLASTGDGLIVGSASSSSPELSRDGAGLVLTGAGTSPSAGTPSNNLHVAGRIVSSNGVIASVNSGYQTNIVPLTVIPHIGTTTNVIEAQGSNGVAILTLSEPGVLTVKSNIILSSVRWVDSPVQLFWAATGPTAPNATPVVPGSQILGSGFSVGGIGTEKVYGSFQVNHNVCASNANVYTEHHLHVSPTNAPSAGSSNIAFTIVYDWANVGGTRFGPYTNTVQIGLTSQTYNNLIEFGHQTNFFPGISAMSRCTIYRTAAASNEYNATVILDGVDVHYPIDRLGSASDTLP